MSLLNLTPPTIGQPNATEDTDIVNAFNTIQTWANGNVDESNMPSAFLQRLGLNGSGTVGRGKSIIATTEGRTNVAYGTLTTPDQVPGIVLPTDGLIVVAYQATWQTTASNACAAAIFIGANQAKWSAGAAAPAVQETIGVTATNTDVSLSTSPGGLVNNAAGVAYSGDVTTGQIIGSVNTSPFNAGPCFIFAAAGTYAVSVQFRASTGTVTVKNRKLWCWAIGF